MIIGVVVIPFAITLLLCTIDVYRWMQRLEMRRRLKRLADGSVVLSTVSTLDVFGDAKIARLHSEVRAFNHFGIAALAAQCHVFRLLAFGETGGQMFPHRAAMQVESFVFV